MSLDPAWDESMAISTDIEPGWVDIVAPQTPMTHSTDPLLWLLIAFCVLSIFAGLFFYFRPRRRARRALRRLLADLHKAPTDGRDCCLQTKRCLRRFFGTAHLQSMQISRDQGWQQYLHRVDKCCYSAEPISVVELQAIVREGLLWLDRKALRK